VGLSKAGVLWLSSFYSGLVICAEVPSGLASDWLGRRRTLCWAFVALGGALAAAALAGRHGLWLLWLQMLLRAVGSALFSGTDMALLYETLKRFRSEHGANESVLGVTPTSPAPAAPLVPTP
jgi:MFS family permease